MADDEWVSTQVFSVEPRHEDAFSTVGHEYWRAKGPQTTPEEWRHWLRRGQELSLKFPGTEVACITLARIRRIYLNGAVLKDWPNWPYLGAPEGGVMW